MPHVVIEEVTDLAAACRGLEPTSTRTGADVLKVIDVFLNQAGRTALVDCLAIEGGRAQSFFVQLAQKDRQVTVRLLPATDPEKTTGVKRLMAMLAKQVRARVAGSRFGKTNLQPFLDEPANDVVQ